MGTGLGTAFVQIHESELHALFPTCDLLPGVERLLNHLHQNKIKIAVATVAASVAAEARHSKNCGFCVNAGTRQQHQRRW